MSILKSIKWVCSVHTSCQLCHDCNYYAYCTASCLCLHCGKQKSLVAYPHQKVDCAAELPNKNQRFSIRMGGRGYYQVVDRINEGRLLLYDLREVFDHLSAEFKRIKLSPGETIQAIDEIGKEICIEVLRCRLESPGRSATGTYDPQRLIEYLIDEASHPLRYRNNYWRT